MSGGYFTHPYTYRILTTLHIYIGAIHGCIDLCVEQTPAIRGVRSPCCGRFTDHANDIMIGIQVCIRYVPVCGFFVGSALAPTMQLIQLGGKKT